jgi:hypothetical protein
MRTEYTRQTRWARASEIIDPEQIPPGSTYVRQMIWVPCTECDLQIHAPYRQLLAEGVDCPECGRQLAAPLSAEEQDAAVRKVREEEDRFRQRLQS